MSKNTKGQKALLAKIRQFEDALPPFRDYLTEEYLNENNEAVIHIDGRGLNGAFEPLSIGVQRELKGELFDFVERKADPIPVEIPLVLQFEGMNAGEEEQESIRQMLKEHYMLILVDKKVDLYYNTIQSILYFLLGLAVLVGAYFLAPVVSSVFFTILLSIIATFSLWEAVDSSLLKRRAIVVDRLNAGQLAMADIRFTGEAPKA